MRRRDKPRPADQLAAEPPPEILRFVPSQPPPIGPHGPQPWALRWEPEEFAEFLRARAAWRDAHEKPLYGLFARELHALTGMADRLPRALVQAERAAERRAPSSPYRPAGPDAAGPSFSHLEEDPAS